MFRKISLCVVLTAAIGFSATISPVSAKDSTPVEPVSSAQAGKAYRVGIVPPGYTSPFHVAIIDGAKAKATDLGWTLEARAPESEGDFTGQVNLVKELIKDGVAAVSATNPGDAIIDAVKMANEQKIPFVMYNSITPLSSGKVDAYVGYDQWGGAEKLGKYTCALLAKKYNTTVEKAKGKVFILTGIESIFSRRRTLGYRAGLKECPGVHVVGEQKADWLRERGEEVATKALTQFPDIDLFYGNSDEMAIGAGIAAEKLGLIVNEDIYTIAIDGNQPTLDLIKEGKFTATLGVYPTKIGETVIDTMNKILSGEDVPQYVMTPSTVVDSANIDDYIAGKTWTDPLAGSPENDNQTPTVRIGG
ncbi:MAG: sugar ABC transporter substrate-binding protein [Anaerolineae bacterium]|nr:sugar ABC transporter substrate-binding protein [Anaerolineae bacterium]